MIFTTIGKPGGGKSLYSLRQIVRYLVSTDNSIITNLSIRLPQLQEYLSKNHPDKDIDVNKRIRLLDVEQSRRFWLYRIDSDGLDHDLKGVTREEEKSGKSVDFQAICEANKECLTKGIPRKYPGVFYVIDECHVFFDSRAWAESGLSLTFYNSQHRKLNDDVMFITQFLELIDKRVKSFSQEFIELRNNGAEKFMTVFRGPSFFTARHYQSPPTGGRNVATEVHRFSLDIPLANCYDTSAGVGISGVGAPETKRKKGLNIAWIAVPAFGALALLYYFPDMLAAGIMSSADNKSALDKLSSNPVASVSQSSPSVVSPISPSLSPPSGQDLTLVGVARRGVYVNVILSDGRTLIETDESFQRIDRNGVVVDGRKVFFARPVSNYKPIVQEVAKLTVQDPNGKNDLRQADNEDSSSWSLGSDGVYRLKPSQSTGYEPTLEGNTYKAPRGYSRVPFSVDR